MSESHQIEVTTTGIVTSTFNKANFQVSVVTVGKTGPEAKNAAKEQIDQIHKVLAKFKTEAALEEDRIKSTFDVDIRHRYDNTNAENVFVGYKATYKIAFDIANVATSIALHDALTSLDQVAVKTPVFLVNNSEEIRNLAFRHAVAQARRRFEEECAALNLKDTDYHIASWEEVPQYESGGKLAKVLNDASGNTDFEPGKAVFSLQVKFIFERNY